MTEKVPISASIFVKVNGRESAQGTAFLLEEHVVTAFHVVGDTATGLWHHDLDLAEYFLDLKGGVQLQPVLADSVADIALLKLDTVSSLDMKPLSLAPEGSEFDRCTWRTIGFPKEVDPGQFALNGKIAEVHSSYSAKSMQLKVEQGTNVNWGGISGAPIIVEDLVAGVVTNITEGANTAWASTWLALNRLIKTFEADLISLVSKITSQLPPDFRWPEQLNPLDEITPERAALWYVERCKIGDLIRSYKEVDRDLLNNVWKLAEDLRHGFEFPNPGPVTPSIPAADVFYSPCWLRTLGKNNAETPNLWCFSVGDDGELIQTPEEKARLYSMHSEVREAWGSITLSSDGSLIALLAQGRLQLLGIDTRMSTVYSLPFQSVPSDFFQNSRVLSVTRSGNREVNLAVQNGNGVALLGVSKNEIKKTRLQIRENSERTSAVFLGQDLLYVKSFVAEKGDQTPFRTFLRQHRETWGGSDGQDIPIIPLPRNVMSWDSHPVFAVDAAIIGGRAYVALLVARPSDGIECKTNERSLLLASVGRKPEEWKWELPCNVEATACSVNIVRDPFGKGDSLCVWVGTELGGEPMQRYEYPGEPTHRPFRRMVPS